MEKASGSMSANGQGSPEVKEGTRSWAKVVRGHQDNLSGPLIRCRKGKWRNFNDTLLKCSSSWRW